MSLLTGHVRQAWRRRAAPVAAFLLLGLLAATAVAGTASPGLEKGYGEDGTVEVSAPFTPGKGSFAAINGFGAAKDGTVYAVGDVYPCLPARCRRGAFLMRLDADGAPDRGFGEHGIVLLHGQDEYPTVMAEGAARVFVAEDGRDETIIRRFRADGDPDRAFGAGGAVKIPCACGEEGAGLLKMSGGRLMVIASRPVANKKVGYGSVATKVRLVELLPDGSRDKSFGHSGAVSFEIPKPGGIGAVARTADDAILFGGVGYEERPRRAWLWRISASGHVDGRFNRNAAHSLRRLGTLGEFPGLASIVPGAHGTIAAVGTIHEHLGFVLRLRGNGKLATGFGQGGLVHLPANVEGAVGGIDNAVFIVGEGKRSYSSAHHYSAYRVLASGHLDPAYRGAHGIKVPLPGEGVGVESQGGGRALVTNVGYYECREDCPAEPGLARFRE
jgi:uncharacterized delta-60 repeat protein